MTQQQSATTLSQPINPFPKPDFVSAGSLHFGSILPVVFSLVLGIWLIYTLVVTYHWIRYGHRSFLTIPLLVIHVMVSIPLILLAAGGMR